MNIADSKASSKRAAIAAATDEDPIQLDSNPSNHRMSNNKLKEDRKHLRLCATYSRANRSIALNKTLTIDDINIPDLTING
ncbi:MAG: hypothetical protein HWQ35_33270 [Nostoc sp. NMS1]|uniref:hypothetical protein n=1 Tax=unclassified Nostoc TaxID=2593658 RepID=UPI0025E0AD64|nr:MULTISPECIES: hypothetical protein [unclassified Nostoc]MBN3911235.1 hypothetical protein [Nostoc sp. NMS1]MBN3990141.1 hypothetical protein [Nostoc sp. NMS2]